MSSNNQQKIKTLEEYKELKELTAKAEKRIREIKAEIKEKYKPGEYGDLILSIEEREVAAYSVAARVDQIIKVVKK